MKKLSLLCFIIFITGCATKEITLHEAKEAPSNQIFISKNIQTNKKSNVVFIRDKGFTGSAVFQHIFIDNKEVAKLNPGEKTELEIKSGEHIFSVKPTDPFGAIAKTTIVVNLKSNHSYCYRIYSDISRTFINRTICKK